MCYVAAIPLAIGMAMATAGTMMNASAQRKNQNQMAEAANDASAANYAKIRQQQDESRSAVNQTIPQFDAASQQDQQQQLTDQRTQTAQDNVGASAKGDYQVASPSAPAVVQSTIARAMSDAIRKGKDSAAAGAALGGINDLNASNQRFLAQQGGQVGQFNNFAQGLANLGPLQIQAARNNAYRAPGPAGDLLQAGGSMLAASSGSFGGGGGAMPMYGAAGAFGTRGLPLKPNGQIAGGI